MPTNFGEYPMSERYPVSRRTSLKNLGILAAAAASGVLAEANGQETPSEPVKSEENKHPENPVDLAVQRLANGHSCAQAVFSAFAEQLGMEYETAVKLTAGFGGGMGLGLVCGAVSGSVMALGLKYGGVDRPAKEQTAKLVREFTDRFKAQRKSLDCHDLLGGDIGTPEGLQAAKDRKLFTVCPGIVADAAKILSELLAADRQDADS
jgi:C_GCAxxG_C_C family probable redox protein